VARRTNSRRAPVIRGRPAGRVLALAGALVVLAAGGAASAAGPATPPPFSGPLTAPGGPFLIDVLGRRVQLHGVNLVAKCGADTLDSSAPGSPCVPGAVSDQPAYVLTPGASDAGRRFTAADARTLRAMGFSVVRLGIIWAALEPGPPGVGPDDPRYCSSHTPGTPFASLASADPYDQATVDAYLKQVDVVVGELAAQGIRVILDMHQDAWGQAFSDSSGPTPWRGEGAPPWATCTSGLPDSHPSGWSQAYADAPVEAAFEHFFANDVSANLQGNFARVWSAVASHFASAPDVIGYEVFNEPANFTLLAPPEFDRQLACFYAGSTYAAASCAATVPPTQALPSGLIPTIEAADPSHLVFFDAPVLTDYTVPDTVGVLERLPFPRLVLSFHDYGGSGLATGSFSCTDPSCGPSEQATMDGFADYRSLTQTAQPGGPAWMLTEFGAEPDATDVGRVAAMADARQLSWIYWAALQLHDPTGGPAEGLLDQSTRRPDAPRAAVLAQTYALATAGTPQSQIFDPTTGDYQLVYTPDPAVSAPTEIVVPLAYHYPHGYRVIVRGASVRSAPGAGLLQVANTAGATTVIVQLSPLRAAAGRPRAGGCPSRRSGGRSCPRRAVSPRARRRTPPFTG
jgi:endoglycosylceramidase